MCNPERSYVPWVKNTNNNKNYTNISENQLFPNTIMLIFYSRENISISGNKNNYKKITKNKQSDIKAITEEIKTMAYY